MSPARGKPVRPERASESIRLAKAREAGPFVAWRDSDGALQVVALALGSRVTAGRTPTHPIALGLLAVSRDHVEFERRLRGKPGEESVTVIDLASRGGTQHRQVTMAKGAELAAGMLKDVPVQGFRPVQLAPGEHDIWLAQEVWLRVGGVRIDLGCTEVEDDGLPAPTKRQHDVLVELCREQHEQETTFAAPTNAVIGARLKPPIGAAYVSEVMSQMYEKYGLDGTKEQNRISLVNLALKHGLVRPHDYL